MQLHPHCASCVGAFQSRIFNRRLGCQGFAHPILGLHVCHMIAVSSFISVPMVSQREKSPCHRPVQRLTTVRGDALPSQCGRNRNERIPSPVCKSRKKVMTMSSDPTMVVEVDFHKFNIRWLKEKSFERRSRGRAESAARAWTPRDPKHGQCGRKDKLPHGSSGLPGKAR